MIRTIEDVKIIVAKEHDFGGSGEVNKSGSMREYLEAEKWLEQRRRELTENGDVIVLLARLAIRMERWDVAVVRWSEVLQNVGSARDEAYYELGLAYRHLGSLPLARRALNKVRDESMSARVVKERKEISTREVEGAARVVGNRAIELLASERSVSAQSLVESVISLRSYEDHVADCILRVVGAIEGAERRRLEWPRKNRSAKKVELDGPPRRAVFFCGFGWSGSGALFDYYSQSPTSARPFGRSEIMAFERYWSAMKVLDVVAKNRGAARDSIVNFILQSVLGIGGPMSLEADRNRRKSVINYFRRDSRLSEAVRRASIALFSQVMDAAGSGDHAEMDMAFRRFFDYIFAAKVPPGKVAMTANCVHAENVGLVRLVTDATAVVVFRDPRDQYVAQSYEHRGKNELSCDEFIREYRSKRNRYEKELAVVARSNNVIALNFEEFVFDSSLRDLIGNRLQVPVEDSLERALKYDPKDSIKNVGIHRTYPDRADISKIEAELGDYLFSSKD